jgi:type IV pilus assembly protein PilM
VIASLFSKAKPGLGVELTPERINIVQLEALKQGIKVSALASVPAPEGAFQDGQIADTYSLAEAIRQGLEDKKIKSRQVVSAIPAGEAVIRLIRLPAELDDFELRDMVLNQEAALYLPFPREEADVDYQKLGTMVDEDGIERVEVLLVATPKQVTDAYLNVFNQAGLQLTVLEVSSFALLRTLRDQLQQFAPGEALAIADIGYDGTEISIVMDGVPQFNRKVPQGTYYIQSAISRAMNLPTAMGGDLLNTLTVPVGIGDTSAANISNPSSAALLSVLGELGDEIRRSIDFFLNQGDHLEVAQLLLAGPGAGLGQIDEFFTQRLSLTTTLVDPFSALSVEPGETPTEQRSAMGVVMGLGLRGTK